MSIWSGLLVAIGILAIAQGVLARKFRRDFIFRDPACPIRDLRWISSDASWLNLGPCEKKNYLKRHAPLFVAVIRVIEILFLLAGLFFLLLWFATGQVAISN